MSKKISNPEELKILRDRFKAEMEVRCIPKKTQKQPSLRECGGGNSSDAGQTKQQ